MDSVYEAFDVECNGERRYQELRFLFVPSMERMIEKTTVWLRSGFILPRDDREMGGEKERSGSPNSDLRRARFLRMSSFIGIEKSPAPPVDTRNAGGNSTTTVRMEGTPMDDNDNGGRYSSSQGFSSSLREGFLVIITFCIRN